MRIELMKAREDNAASGSYKYICYNDIEDEQNNFVETGRTVKS